MTQAQAQGGATRAIDDSEHGHGEVGHADPHDGQQHHPGPGQYVGIALILGLITAVEVMIYYFDINKPTLVTALVVLSITKFALVAAFFMHLKFDNKLFTTFFAAGLVVAIVAFIAVLSMFRVIF